MTHIIILGRMPEFESFILTESGFDSQDTEYCSHPLLKTRSGDNVLVVNGDVVKGDYDCVNKIR